MSRTARLAVRWCWLVLCVLALPVSAAPEQVTTVNFAKDEFVFPDDIRGSGQQLVFLGMATNQDNGAYQGETLIEWQQALTDAAVLPERATAWHFSVMDNVPFFVKGIVRRGIAKTYRDVLAPQHGAVLYVKDLERFAAAAGLPLDGEPTVALYDPQQGLTEVFRGPVSPAGIAAVEAALRAAAVPASAAPVDAATSP